MSRLPILTLLAVPGLLLAACDQPSPLAKAKPGECYTVVGKDNAGTKLAKTACAGSPAAIAAACPTPVAPAALRPQGAAAACPAPVATTAAAGGVKTLTSYRVVKHRAAHKATTQRRVQFAHRGRAATTGQVWYDDGVAKSGEVTSLRREYARVDEDLAGGPPAYQDYGYERREHHSRYEQAAPPARFYEKREYHGGYEQAPPPRFVERSYQGGSAAYSEHSRASRAYSESYSSSSSSSSSRGAYGGAQCDCDDRGAPPRSPFDGNGFLTWRNKTPG